MKILLIVLLYVFTTNAYALKKLRLGILAYGTVNWELSLMQKKKLALKYGIDLEVKKLASKNAVSIALQANDVDIIVSDFIWVSRQRAAGADFTFYPYSKAVGGLYVNPKDNISSILDLENKRLGVSGGAVSKTWLITRAYSLKKYKKDLKDIVNVTFASPPILNKKILDSSLSGIINFWHFNARLKAKGMKNILSMKTILLEFGIEEEIPIIGWVFSQKFANENKKLINAFLQASYETKKLLNDGIGWKSLKKQMKVKNEKVYHSLIEGYKAGIPKSFSNKEKDAAKKVFNILSKMGGTKLVGKSTKLQEGTFWDFSPNIKW